MLVSVDISYLQSFGVIKSYLYFQVSFSLLWLEKDCMWLFREQVHAFLRSLYLVLCTLCDSSVFAIVSPTPVDPVLSAKMLPGAEH